MTFKTIPINRILPTEASPILGTPIGISVYQDGVRINEPSIPKNTVKFGSEYQIFEGWFFGGDLQHASSLGR